MAASSLIATVTVLSAAACDWRSGRIPNALTYGAAAFGLTLAVATGALGVAAAGFAVGITIALALFFLGGLGGGDAKLLAALGLLLGPSVVVEIIGYSFALGAAWSLITVMRLGLGARFVMQIKLGSLLALTPGARQAQILPPIAVRFGPIIALSTLLVMCVPALAFLGDL
jgi:prepilin peptidase CpaA